jgi:hypothetical protein
MNNLRYKNRNTGSENSKDSKREEQEKNESTTIKDKFKFVN